MSTRVATSRSASEAGGPRRREFAWQAEKGITSLFMHDVRELGIREVVRRAIEIVGPGPVFLTVDIDVLDPAFAPGTGTPEPGGMTTIDLLWACRTVATELELVGADVVEVLPLGDRGHHSARRQPGGLRDPDRPCRSAPPLAELVRCATELGGKPRERPGGVERLVRGRACR